MPLHRLAEALADRLPSSVSFPVGQPLPVYVGQPGFDQPTRRLRRQLGAGTDGGAHLGDVIVATGAQLEVLAQPPSLLVAKRALEIVSYQFDQLLTRHLIHRPKCSIEIGQYRCPLRYGVKRPGGQAVTRTFGASGSAEPWQSTSPPAIPPGCGDTIPRPRFCAQLETPSASRV